MYRIAKGKKMKTVEKILWKIHELKTEIHIQEDVRNKYTVVEYYDMKSWVEALEWVLEE